jgi:DNA gyrase/topoisomerase IV subunit B
MARVTEEATSAVVAGGNGTRRKKAAGSDYNAASIQVLEGLEAVRRRPGMYIGSTDERGLHHLVWEVVDNSIDEAMAGHAHKIDVTVGHDNMVTVVDDGRGVPVGRHSTGKDALEVVHTVLHAGGKFGGGGYKVSGGLHGVGVSVVNALSEWMRVESARDGQIYFQEYARGKPTTPVKKIGPAGDRRGTTTRFRADPEMFDTTEYSFDLISQRLRESAYLTKGVWITLRDERLDRERSFYFEGGLVSFVRHLNRNKEAINSRPIYCERRDGSTMVEVALQYNDSYTENVLAFANNINTVDGGTHVTGFRAAADELVNDWARRAGILKDADGNLSGDDVREGLTAVVSVKLTDPQFEGQTKAKLGNAEVKGQVQTALGDAISQYLDENPGDGRRIIEKCLTLPAHARRPARPATSCSARARSRACRSRQARRLPGARPGAERDLHRRGRLGRWIGEGGPRSALPGDPADVRQGPERREGPARQGPLEREDPAADHRPRRRHRRGLRPHEDPLPPDHHHDRRRRRRRPHPDAAADVLLPPPAEVIERGYLYIAQPPLFRVSTARSRGMPRPRRTATGSSRR